MKPQSMLFTIYGEYVRHYGGEIWVGSLTRLIGEFGLSEQAVRVAISRMVRQGWLVSRKIGNRSYYSLTERGKKRLNEAAQRIYKQHPNAWNGKWCIISYNIPETKRALRDQLRKELAWMGFGMLANSTWISPNDLADRVKEITESYEVNDYVEIFTSEHLGWSSPKQLVEKCWNLDEINAAYQEFIKQFQTHYENLKQKIENKEAISDSDCFVAKTQLVHEYRKFLFIDPSLPEELLPDFWMGREADELFRKYYDLLNPGAVRFFLQVFETAPDKE
ncbi:phenylacetic acid degradation operon negative regulatory protein PaaX [Collibacillus ludicampi]|jgi:phenylacetic acid degradation operon negative regulatory protein|uniref:Phenylacetic acid degradation operon negative regulatory protein PaaX n=1 Tax=Collibacillus ludicampi TaxID=2771369 RepID=A0AAV4LKJ1_9BACL|nr:phenylacetic acid degradation operon negative regulatory protein PaaX [Collibacillus ludicampi]GIM48118.1 phenylacetic acid degradation operon negative regulatory protein PaaX [Collibacillus ludicampi]